MTESQIAENEAKSREGLYGCCEHFCVKSRWFFSGSEVVMGIIGKMLVT